jgi:heterodisulfide reductase subunit C
VKIYEKKPVDANVLTDISCDVCGGSCHSMYGYEYATLNAVWGYESSRDGDVWECYICDKCSSKIKAYIESLGGRVEV